MAQAKRVGDVVDTRDIQLTLTNDEATAYVTFVNNCLDTYGAPEGTGVKLLKGIATALTASTVNVKSDSSKHSYKGIVEHQSPKYKY